jgi:SSS family solute:Na+ symporter
LGVNFIAWLKILTLPLFIGIGILCFILFPGLKDPAEAYMTMVTNIFPPGMNGLVIVVLIAVLVGTIGSSLNSLSTVFTMDVYAKRINPAATNADKIRVGRITVIAGCLFAIGMALAIDSIKGLNLFDVFQSVLGFIAPPLAVVFLLTVFWKRTTKKAVNTILSAGSVFSLGVGVLYLWVFTPDKYPVWPHYLLLSFYIFAVLFIAAVVISLLDPSAVHADTSHSEKADLPVTTKRVKIAWGLLVVVMVTLYIIFNGH